MRPNTSTNATRASAAGAALLRMRSCRPGSFHIGNASGLATGVVWKGALTTRTESPRSLLKPMPCCTRAVSFSSSSADSGVLLLLPLASMIVRWLTTTAALRRRTWPEALRVTLTFLSTS